MNNLIIIILAILNIASVCGFLWIPPSTTSTTHWRTTTPPPPTTTTTTHWRTKITTTTTPPTTTTHWRTTTTTPITTTTQWRTTPTKTTRSTSYWRTSPTTTTKPTTTYWKTTTPVTMKTTTDGNKVLNGDATLLNQILMQETTLRLELEKTVKQMISDFEKMKKVQSASESQISTLIQAKAEQDVLNRHLHENITSVRAENENLKHELSTIRNSSLFSSGSQSCHCDIKNVTKKLEDFKTDVRYMTLSLLDLQQKTDVMKDRIDGEIMNLTTRYFDMENQDALLLSTVENLERIRPTVENFMNETRDLKSVLLRIQHEQIGMETDIVNLKNNVSESSERVAFTATVTQYMTSQNGQTLVFPHVITNIGGGYNNSSGVFTAPRDGAYVFVCKITGRDNSDDLYFEFILNGSVKIKNLVHTGSAHPYRTSSNSIVLQLRHGDRVWVRMSYGGNHFSSGAGGDQSFSGFLL